MLRLIGADSNLTAESLSAEKVYNLTGRIEYTAEGQAHHNEGPVLAVQRRLIRE